MTNTVNAPADRSTRSRAFTRSSSPINVTELSVQYESDDAELHLVLDNVSLECQPGELVVLIGPSGCGKTTLLNTLCGLVNPSSGTVSVLGSSPKDARTKLGYMMARDALLPWRTAVRNVELSMEIHGYPRAKRRAQAEKYLRMMKLDKSDRKYPWQLSQGMRQRVALARTWSSEPELILMDEPFSALDAQTRDVARDEFLQIWDRDRKTVVFVTHDLTEAALMGDRVILLNKGKIQLDVKVPFPRPRRNAELENDPEFLAFKHDLWLQLTDAH